MLLDELAVGDAGGRRIDAERVKEAFSIRGAHGRQASRPNIRAMTSLAAKYFGIKVPELLGPTRRRSVVTARNLVIYLARQLGDISLEQLGKHFGGRDHTTVLHGYRVIEERLRSDPELRQAHDDLRKMLVQGGGS
ncbi:MAG: helix-turn-helix domain-containing protein [Pirellulales bacterium]